DSEVGATATSTPRLTSVCQSPSPPSCASSPRSCGSDSTKPRVSRGPRMRELPLMADDEVMRRLARSSGLSRAGVGRLVELEVVVARPGAPETVLVRRLRRARRLRRDLGLSFDAVAIILRLLDRIELLERAASRR